MPTEVSAEESMPFSYWTVILKLLELGFPWAAIHDLQEREISVILGVQAALAQRQADADAATQRQGTHFSHVRGQF